MLAQSDKINQPPRAEHHRHKQGHRTERAKESSKNRIQGFIHSKRKLIDIENHYQLISFLINA